MKTIVKLIKKRLQDDRDLVIAITGEERTGKSTLAIQLGMAIDPNFDLEKNVTYMPTAKEIQKEFSALPKGSAYIIDEAALVMHKHDWMTNLQKMINKMYITKGYLNICTILCIPRFTDLTEYFRNHRVKLWIHILKRGHAFVYARDEDRTSADPWHIQLTRSYKGKIFGWKKLIDRSFDKILEIERKCINYVTDFEFGDLPEDIKKRYNELKRKAHEKEDDTEEDEENVKRLRTIYFNRLINFCKEKNSLTDAQIAEIIGSCRSLVTKIRHEATTYAKRLFYINTPTSIQNVDNSS